MARVEIRDADGGRRELVVEEGVVFGREPGEGGMVLGDPRCSRRHGRFERREGRWAVVDLGSANGTRVNGMEVSRKTLSPGDVIEAGDTVIVFSPTAGAPAAPAEPSRRRRRDRTPAVLAILAGVAVLAASWSFLGGENPRNEPESPGAAGAGPSSTASADHGGAEEGDREEILEAPVPDALIALEAEFAALDVTEARARLEALEELEATEPARERLKGLRDRLDERLRALLENSVSATAAEVEPLIRDGRFGAAIERWRELLLEARLAAAGGAELSVRKEMGQVLAAARADWDALVAEARRAAAGGDADAARRILDARVADFRGTHFEVLARSERQLLDLRAADREEAARASVAPEGGDGAGVAKDARDAAAGLVRQAETLAGESDWSEAARAYRRAIEAMSSRPEEVSGWSERAALLESMGRLKAEVVLRATDDPEGLGRLRIGRRSARVVAATDRGVELALTGGEGASWGWTEIAEEALLDLFRKVVRTPELRLDLGIVAFSLDAREFAENVLARGPEDGAYRASAARIVAAARGIAIPPEGFAIVDGRFLTPAEAADIERRARAEKLGRELALTRSDPEVERLADELALLGEAGRTALADALSERLERALSRLRESPAFKKPEGLRRSLLTELESRREAALALIRDEVRYPYPYAANQPEIQAEVDALVERVREVWERPHETLRSLADGWARARAEIDGLEERLGRLDRPSRGGAEIDAEIVARLELRDRAWSQAQARSLRDTLDWNEAIDSSITAEERGVHDLTNAYRMMMGLLPVKIDEALVLAARGHSEEMRELGYFAHESPVPERRTPSQRARLAGWSGGVAENIARGQQTPEAAVRGWLSSSGHHRNILGARHTHLGCGKSAEGAFWTQNFGTGSSSSISKPRRDR